MNLTKLIGSFNFKKFGKASRTDFGVLKVAFMVAALDGEVTADEYAAFDALAKKCRGYTPKAAAEALNDAMRSAGYLLLLSKRVKKNADLVKAFVAEARAALPNGFAYLSLEDVRRAIVTWIMMGMSDGAYSVRERACIEALRKFFAERKVMKLEQEAEQWMALATDFRQTYGGNAAWMSGGKVKLITKDFVHQVESLVSQYGDTADAAKELQGLIKSKA